MGRPVRIALIGAGAFVRKAHAPSLLELGDAVQIAAVYSRTQASAETVAESIPYDVDTYTDIGMLLADESVEAVDIVLPIPMLPEVVSQALAAGKHVFSEKPIAQTVAEAQALIAACRHFDDLVWMVGENWRYEEAFQAGARAVQAGGAVHECAPWYRVPTRRGPCGPEGKRRTLRRCGCASRRRSYPRHRVSLRSSGRIPTASTSRITAANAKV